jgi:cytochrome c oxidase assembly factor CtaG
MILGHAAPALASAPALAEILGRWDWRADAVAALLVLGGVYVTGWTRLRRRGQATIGVSQLALYLTGLVAIALALLSPIEALAEHLLALHMVQHELLTMVAAPLLLLGNPFTVGLWALAESLRHRIGRLLARGALVRRALIVVTAVPVGWLLYGTVLWGWHLPAAYQAALRSPLLHDLEHLSFVGAALIFWWPVINPAPRVRHLTHAIRLAYVVAAVGLTMMPGSMIAVFAPRVLYPYYASRPRLWGLSPLDDQSLGWGLMAVLDGLVYAVALLTLVYGAAMREERTTRLREALGLPAGGVQGRSLG